MTEITMNDRDVRRFLLAKHGLWPPRALAGREGILAVSDRLASIQFDPLNVVGRNSDLVLQSRVEDYRPGILYDLLYVERALYDYWDKMMCLVPMGDWPNLELQRAWWRARHAQRLAEFAEHVERIVGVIRERGPMSSLDFDEQHNVGWKTDWRWGRMRAAKAIMEMLGDTGDLMVSHRQGARRYYDLAERVVPHHVAAQPLAMDKQAYMVWRLARRCQGIGLVGPGLGGEAWAGVGKAPQRAQAIEKLLKGGEMVSVRIDGDKRTYYALTRDLPFLEQARTAVPKRCAAFIAPLDNLLWSRTLIERLFGFRYSWEVYKPAHQRQYGYYVLPVLYGDRFVARIDPKFDRESGELHVLSWHWEPHEELTEPLANALSVALTRFAEYLGAERVVADPSVDPDIAALATGVQAAGQNPTSTGGEAES